MKKDRIFGHWKLTKDVVKKKKKVKMLNECPRHTPKCAFKRSYEKIEKQKKNTNYYCKLDLNKT